MEACDAKNVLDWKPLRNPAISNNLDQSTYGGDF